MRMKNDKGQTALILASIKGHPKRVKLLLVEIELYDNDGTIALMQAIMTHH